MNLLRNFFAGLYAFSHKQYDLYKTEKLLKEFGNIGEDAYIHYSVLLRGGKYISVGNGFYCGMESRIEAWDYYKRCHQSLSPCISIGNNVRISARCHIGAIQLITIGDNVLMGSDVFITDHAHGNSSADQINIAPYDRPLYSKGPVIIENNVWICEGAMILPGVVIGQGSIIAANAVVTENIPPYSIAAGVPAKVVKSMKE